MEERGAKEYCLLELKCLGWGKADVSACSVCLPAAFLSNDAVFEVRLLLQRVKALGFGQGCLQGRADSDIKKGTDVTAPLCLPAL